MPERLPTTRPTILAGTNMTSGDPNTGQLMNTLGGSKTFSQMSGLGASDVRIWAGGGRLDHVELHPNGLALASGPPVIFYDSAVAVSGGPIATSGHKIISKIAPQALALQFTIPLFLQSGGTNFGGVAQVGRVFTSGLVVVGTSGMNGITVSFTPVVSGVQPN